MRDLSHSEQSHVDSLNAILECDELEVEFSKNGPVLDRLDENPTAIEFFDEFDNVALGSYLRECNIWFTELSCRWRAKTGSPELGGEFRLRDLYDSILLPPPQFTLETAGASDLAIYEQLRVVDFPQHAGTGHFAAIRIQQHVDPLEMWYYDMRLSTAPGIDSDLVKLDLTYCQYLEALLLTKGVFGWQYLFADITLRGIVFRDTVERLKRMLEVFPELFPDHDYGDLAARLEARL
ncbi:hypothetical protein ACQEV2_04780 [Streptomyces sp. CA-251387]|uniref:hypothetical protein n=1 Tax=Streptomyces sp. CA-251387 TaxID=3240064 RepID=UPI003D93EC89